MKTLVGMVMATALLCGAIGCGPKAQNTPKTDPAAAGTTGGTATPASAPPPGAPPP
ncbi:MAG: hypothetical protein U1A78_07240 [Polyangia bacterium]